MRGCINAPGTSAAASSTRVDSEKSPRGPCSRTSSAISPGAPACESRRRAAAAAPISLTSQASAPAAAARAAAGASARDRCSASQKSARARQHQLPASATAAAVQVVLPGAATTSGSAARPKHPPPSPPHTPHSSTPAAQHARSASRSCSQHTSAQPSTTHLRDSPAVLSTRTTQPAPRRTPQPVRLTPACRSGAGRLPPSTRHSTSFHPGVHTQRRVPQACSMRPGHAAAAEDGHSRSRAA